MSGYTNSMIALDDDQYSTNIMTDLPPGVVTGKFAITQPI
jgi:hypothetical protein